MRQIIIILALLGTSLPATGQTPGDVTHSDAARMSAAHDLIEVIMPSETRDALFKSIIDSSVNSSLDGVMDADPSIREMFDKMPSLQPIFGRFVERQKDLAMEDLRETTPELLQAYAQAYARHFTAAELSELKSFFSTEVGSRFSRVSDESLSDPAVQEWMRLISAKAHSRERDELKRLIQEITPVIQAEEAKERQNDS